jgi:hypothetical protein
MAQFDWASRPLEGAQDVKLLSEYLRCLLCILGFLLGLETAWVDEEGDHRCGGEQLVQQLQSFADQ